MSSFDPGDRVVLDQGLPGSADNMGTVVRTDDEGYVWVQWEGPEAPPDPARFSARALRLA